MTLTSRTTADIVGVCFVLIARRGRSRFMSSAIITTSLCAIIALASFV